MWSTRDELIFVRGIGTWCEDEYLMPPEKAAKRIAALRGYIASASLREWGGIDWRQCVEQAKDILQKLEVA